MSDHDPPDLSNIGDGDDLKVYYLSRRSGNEVSRRGSLAFTSTENGTKFWFVHTDTPHQLKHQYVVLYETEDEDGNVLVLAASMTVSAEPPKGGDPVRPGHTFHVTFSIDQQTTLGIVDRVMENGVNIDV